MKRGLELAKKNRTNLEESDKRFANFCISLVSIQLFSTFAWKKCRHQAMVMGDTGKFITI